MSEPAASSTATSDLGREDSWSALFANLVLQQTDMTLLLLGKVPHPETGKTVRDLEHAQLLIGQLEMLEHKTKGNLSKPEAALLQQSLMSLRMAFVEAVESPAAAMPSGTESAAPAPEATTASEEDSRKRFTKKY